MLGNSFRDSIFISSFFLSFAQSIKTALPFIRLTLSDLTFASLVLVGKTREDLLALILRPYQDYE